MGLVARALGADEQRSHPRNPSFWVQKLFGGGPTTAAGNTIDADTALTLSAVYNAVRLLAETVASLPLVTYQRIGTTGTDKRPDRTHPLFPVLHDLPNPWQTSLEWREMMQGHLALRGAGYSEIFRNRQGEVEMLVPLHPDHVEPRLAGTTVLYRHTPATGQARVLPQERVLAVRGWSSSGPKPMSPIALARESLGLTAAQEEASARLFGNSAVPKGVLKHPAKLGDKARVNLTESWEDRHGGTENMHRIAVLEEGMSWEQVGLTAEDAQWLQSRKFQVNEVARWFNLPPHMIKDLDRATFSNIEQQAREFVIFSMRPWFVRWEQAMFRDLYLESERRTHFSEFNVDGLLRGDVKTRWETYGIARQNGILNANEIRSLENLSPQDGDQGDTYLVPLNMVPADSVADTDFGGGSDDGVPADDGVPDVARALAPERRALQQRSIRQRLRLRQVHTRSIADGVRRFLTREIRSIRGLMRKFLPQDPEGFNDAVVAYYVDHRDVVARSLGPALETYGRNIHAAAADEITAELTADPKLERFLAEYTEAVAKRETALSRNQVLTVAGRAESMDQAVTDVEERLGEWEDRRPAKVARREVVELDGAISKLTYASLGAFSMTWVALGDNCPLCSEFDGRTVGVDGAFMRPGDQINADGANALITKQSVTHPPLHDGCDCVLVAG